jgi:hypothetical protein
VNSAGTRLLYSSYLGGAGVALEDGSFIFGDDTGSDIAVDKFGDAYVTGYTDSPSFPLQNAFQSILGGSENRIVNDPDAFATKLSAMGNELVYSTYLGGSNADQGNDIDLDRFGHAYITGFTNSTDFPTNNAFQTTNLVVDAFVTKINPTGSDLVYSTYLGGDSSDQGNGIVVDRFGSIYVTGFTASDNFPILKPFQSQLGGLVDGFVTKISP